MFLWTLDISGIDFTLNDLWDHQNYSLKALAKLIKKLNKNYPMEHHVSALPSDFSTEFL